MKNFAKDKPTKKKRKSEEKPEASLTHIYKHKIIKFGGVYPVSGQ